MRPLVSRALPAMGLAALALGFAYELWRHVRTAGDFWTFWAAARAVAAGLDPYRFSALTRVAPLPAGPAPGPFLSPLFLAEAMRPLGALPFSTARLLWLALNLALSAGAALLLLRQGGIPLRPRAVLAGAALLAAFQPFDITLWLGQTDVLVVAALAAAWHFLGRGRPLAAGLLAAAAAIDVHLMLGFGIYLLYRAVARREYLPLAGLAAGLAVEAGLCLLHPADVARWLLVTLPHAQAAAIEPWDTLSVLQAAHELLGGAGATAAAAALGVGVVGLALAAWRDPSATPERDLAVAAALTLATTTFAYNQDYLVLALAFPYLARSWRSAEAPSWTGALALCLAAGYGLSVLTGGPVAPSHAVFVLGAPLLALATAAGLSRAGARPARGVRFWGGAWAALTLGGYAAFTATRYEVGPELLLLAGVLGFLALAALHRAPAAGRTSGGGSAPVRQRAAERAAPDPDVARGGGLVAASR